MCSLREELKNQSAEFASLQSRLRESQLSLSDLQSKAVPTEFELARVAHEKTALQSKLLAVEEELRAKAKAERDLRSESTAKIHAAESRQQEAQALCEDYKKQIAALRDQTASQQEKLDSFLAKLKESESAAVQQQSAFAQENESVKRLADLYKRYFEEATAKVEELEAAAQAQRDAHNAKTARLKESITAQFEARETEFEAERADYEARIQALDAQVAELQQQAQSRSEYSIVVDPRSAPVSSAAADLEGVGITEMFDRVVGAEKALFAERSKRREVELYLNQILKDIEAKAPAIASQRRDYHRIVESHTRLAQKLDALVAENTALRGTVQEAETRTQQAVEEASALEQHNNDLSAQLQHVLKQGMTQSVGGQRDNQQGSNKSGAASAGAVISEHLLTFDDVAELQLRNAQLLKVVRKLSQEQEQESALMITGQQDAATIGGGSRSKEVSEALKAALLELNSMREARRRTEDMVAGLVQQRDMYRAMVEQESAVAPGPATPGKTSSSVPGTPAQSSALTLLASPAQDQGRVTDLQWKLAQSEDEKRRLQERMSRLEEAEKLLHESLDKIRAESSAARMEAAQASSEARFQRERSERLENSLKTAQLESASALQRRLDIERTLVDLQRDLRARDDRIAEANEKLRTVAEAQRRADIEVEVARASESRVVAQLQEAREEVKRHASLAEYLQRIESGLQSKAEEEKDALTRERDALARNYEALRKQVDERGLIEDQRLRSLEDDLRSAKARLEERTAEVTSVTTDLIREQSLSKAAQDRSNLLERQLSIAQERLSSTQGAQILDSISASEAAAKELQLERLAGEVESLKAQLATSEGHAEQFRRISTTNEAALKELRAKAAETRAALEEEASKARQERDVAVAELAEHRASTSNLLGEVEEVREQLRAANAASAEAARALQDEVALARQQSEQVSGQLELLKADAVKFQAAAKSAYANYERELQLHAEAERQLRSRDDELGAAKDALAAAQHQAADMSAALIRKEGSVEEERARFRAEEALLKEQLEGLQRSNDLLHAQVQSFGVQVDRLQESRVAAATAGESTAATAPATASPDSSDQVSPSAGAEEVADLRKSNNELREVLRYLKKEKDMIAARLAVAETESSRHQGELHVASRALDEARAELKRELDRRVTVRSEEEFARLMAEVTQLNLVRESNAHLRGENEELSRRATQAAEELAALRSAKAPLEEALRKAQAEKESLELVNDQLSNDVGYWRERLQKLVSRYNDVDPEEHRLVKAQLEQTQAALASAQADLAAAATQAKEQTDALAAKDKELAAAAASREGAVSSANQLRSKLREFKTAKDASEAKVAEATKHFAGLEAQLTTVTRQLEAARAEVATLTIALTTAQSEAAAVKSAVSASAPQVQAAVVASPPIVRGASSGNLVGEAAVSAATTAAPAAAGGTGKKRDRATQERENESAAATLLAATEAAAEPMAVESAVPVTSASSAVATPAVAAAAPAAVAESAPDRMKSMKAQLQAKKQAAIALAKKKQQEEAAAAVAAATATAATEDAPEAASAAAAVSPPGKKARVAQQEVTPAVPAAESEPVVDEQPAATEAMETVAEAHAEAAETAAPEVSAVEPPVPAPASGDSSPSAEVGQQAAAPPAVEQEAKKSVGTGNPFMAGGGSGSSIFGGGGASSAGLFKQATATAASGSRPFGGFGAFGKPTVVDAAPAVAQEAPTMEEGEMVEEPVETEAAAPGEASAEPESAPKAAAPVPAKFGAGPFSQQVPTFGSAKSGGLFGSAGSGSGLFGKPAGEGAKTPLFGASATTTTTAGGGLFGKPATGGLFGSGAAAKPIASPFGAPASSAPFGSTTSSGFGGGFGSSAPAAPVSTATAPSAAPATSEPAVEEAAPAAGVPEVAPPQIVAIPQLVTTTTPVSRSPVALSGSIFCSY